MKLQVFVLTAGNPILFETLDSIKEHADMPYSLCVWYHPLDEDHAIDLEFFKKICTYTDDVILATKNQTCPAASGYSMIYKDYDYILSLNDDMSIKKEAIHKMISVHENTNKTAFVGEGTHSHKMPRYWEVNNIANLPDWGGMYSRVAIDDIGALGAFFPTYGFDGVEWMMRAMGRGYKIFSYKDLILHGGKQGKAHDSAHKTKNIDEIQTDSWSKLRVCEDLGYKNYNWWGKRI